MSEIFLETERLILRRFTWTDVDDLVELDSDPAVMRYLSGAATPRDVVIRETMPRLLSYYERFAGYGYWAAIVRESGEFIGWFHFRPSDDSRPDDAELGVARVNAFTMFVNAGSRRVMEKSGLTLVRTFFGDWPEVIEGSEFGDVEYALTRREWEEAGATRRGTP